MAGIFISKVPSRADSDLEEELRHKGCRIHLWLHKGRSTLLARAARQPLGPRHGGQPPKSQLKRIERMGCCLESGELFTSAQRRQHTLTSLENREEEMGMVQYAGRLKSIVSPQRVRGLRSLTVRLALYIEACCHSILTT